MDFTELPPGRELDALVAEKVMGWRRVEEEGNVYFWPTREMIEQIRTEHPDCLAVTYFPAPEFSTDIAAAWEVVEKLGIGLTKTKHGSWMAFVPHRDTGWVDELAVDVWCEEAAEAPTAAHAICLVALKATEGRMSIDARVETVLHNEDGSGELVLVDRPARPGGFPGTAGQPRLRFDRSPHEVTALNGLDVWGGSSSLMLGDVEIARREGYTRIVFHDDETFRRAVVEYRRKRK